MSKNLLNKRSTPARAKDRAAIATDALREAAETVRDQADSLLSGVSEPAPKKAKSPLKLVAAIAAVALVGYAIRKALGGGKSSREGVPSPGSVSPTAPLGPTDPSLNDPALKSKVESILFAPDDAPKGAISVDVSNGVVTLRGELDSSQQASELATSAEQVEGVRRVENLISQTSS